MKRDLEIITPENVIIRHELAGLGSRFIAFFLDKLLQLLLIVVLGIVFLIVISNINVGIMDYLTEYGMIISSVLVIITFGYNILFEMVMNGRTPGKRIAGLRVIQTTGEPVTFTASVVRNLLRVGDMLPGLYITGSLFIVLSRQYARVGDLAANTVVIKERRILRPEVQESLKNGGSVLSHDEKWKYKITDREYAILKEFMKRAENRELGSRESVFEYHLNRHFSNKLNIHDFSNLNYDFFNKILECNAQ